MIRLLDGPAAGSVLALHRAPLFLRVGVSPSGKVDGLDQLDDVAAPRETIHVYQRPPGAIATVHINMGGARKGTGFYPLADYRHVADVDGESVRATEAWQAWASAQVYCPSCEGHGWVVGSTLGCCGNVLDSGECCAAKYGTDRLVPEQTQEQCGECGGSGRRRELVAS